MDKEESVRELYTQHRVYFNGPLPYSPPRVPLILDHLFNFHCPLERIPVINVTSSKICSTRDAYDRTVTRINSGYTNRHCEEPMPNICIARLNGILVWRTSRSAVHFKAWEPSNWMKSWNYHQSMSQNMHITSNLILKVKTLRVHTNKWNGRQFKFFSCKNFTLNRDCEAIG